MIVPGNGPRFASMDDVQSWVLGELVRHGEYVAPRGEPTRELVGYGFVLTQPRARLLTSPARKWSLPLAIGEFCWHAAGSQDVDGLAYYAPRWRSFADADGIVRGSCYGYRIFSPQQDGMSRWDRLLALLRADPATRRAVLDLSDPTILSPTSLDVSCTSTFQVLIRAGLVHVIVEMRSNDAVWGLPYDVFLFTMIQEMIAKTLGFKLGSYIHVVGSLHLYEKHISLAYRVLAESRGDTIVMPEMEPVEEVEQLLNAERAIRKGTTRPPLSPYWSKLADVLQYYRNTRIKT